MNMIEAAQASGIGYGFCEICASRKWNLPGQVKYEPGLM
jgi:hypothetical protein